MQPRRSKVAPDPLLYPEQMPTMAAASRLLPSPNASVYCASTVKPFSLPGPLMSKERREHPRNGAQYPPRYAGVVSPVMSPGTAARGGVAEVFSPSLNVYRAGSSRMTFSIAPRTTVVVSNHVTNTGAVVRLEQVDYSKAMRAYRVCRQEGGIVAEEQPQGWRGGSTQPSTPLPPSLAASYGSASSYVASPTTASGSASPNGHVSDSARNGEEALGHSSAPWRLVLLRLFGAADMVLLAVAVACFLVLVSRLRVAAYDQGDSQNTAPSSSLAWLTMALAALTSGRAVVDEGAEACGVRHASGEAVLEGAAQSPRVASSLSKTAATCVTAPKRALSASYAQATGAPALDTSLTLTLLVLSTFLLTKRLGGALRRVYVEEILVMRGVGLQLSAYDIFNTLRYRRFVDLLMLRSLVIHDAFLRYQPIFFLSSSVENKAERIVYFPETLPRLAVLRPVLNGIRGVLYGEPEDGPSLAEMEERWRKSVSDLTEGDFFTEDSFAEDTTTTPDDACLSDVTDREED
ncbi:hypothetical protein LSCM1_07155 [Leishmania martiniquensis]|uniref:Phosphatidylinositol N-acetylglucosaminyltransferase subunit H conserved domain-containing protein n=1 Tax=Leishmania martiniquensis TaxID=1580590 RepID=A0A836H4K9_9TRYP|nr:hypothetical protein LSCM1_07155 [Leishmania martiniquensis]